MQYVGTLLVLDHDFAAVDLYVGTDRLGEQIAGDAARLKPYGVAVLELGTLVIALEHLAVANVEKEP
jgi:hypothetical protein